MEVSPGKTRIGFIGIGVMGRHMCCHIVKGGYQVTVYNRTLSKAEEFAREYNCSYVHTLQELLTTVNVIITMVGYPKDVEEILLGDGGVAQSANEDTICIDMTSSSPELSEKIYEQLKKKNIHSLDAPVTGGDTGAKEGTLSIFVGGDEEVYRAALPLFKIMGTNITYFGKPGSGQRTKLTNQILIAMNLVGICEALLFAQKAGLDLDKVLAAVSTGAAGSWSLTYYASRILNNDFKPGFYVHHFIKDLGNVLSEARKMNLSLPGLGVAYQLYMSVKAQGNGHLSTQALYLSLAKLNGMDIQIPDNWCEEMDK